MASLDYDQAAKLLAKAQQAAPDSAAVTVGMATLHNHTGQADRALPMLQNLWKTLLQQPGTVGLPLQSEVMAQVGRAFEIKGQHDAALSAYLLAHQIHPSENSKKLIAGQQQRSVP